MNSPVYPDTAMECRELEPGLEVYECPKSGGMWIPLQTYLRWRERHGSTISAPAEAPSVAIPEDYGARALICPESGRLLLRYRVGHGFPFHVDRSPATGGVWLDRGEWEALKSKGLHLSLHLIFSAAYQRRQRTSDYNRRMNATFQEPIGETDFAKVVDFTAWLARHPKGRDICCYPLDSLEHRPENESAPEAI